MDSTTSLGSLFQYLTTLSVKEISPNIQSRPPLTQLAPWFSQAPKCGWQECRSLHHPFGLFWRWGAIFAFLQLSGISPDLHHIWKSSPASPFLSASIDAVCWVPWTCTDQVHWRNPDSVFILVW